MELNCPFRLNVHSFLRNAVDVLLEVGAEELMGWGFCQTLPRHSYHTIGHAKPGQHPPDPGGRHQVVISVQLNSSLPLNVQDMQSQI